MKKIVIIALGMILLVLGIRAIIPSKDIDIHALHQYCKNNGFDTDHCILVDFSRPSGVNRFYIYSFREDKIIHRSLCANGHGKEWNIFCRKFSNEPGSNYSSLGKYIGHCQRHIRLIGAHITLHRECCRYTAVKSGA